MLRLKEIPAAIVIVFVALSATLLGGCKPITKSEMITSKTQSADSSRARENMQESIEGLRALLTALANEDCHNK